MLPGNRSTAAGYQDGAEDFSQPSAMSAPFPASLGPAAHPHCSAFPLREVSALIQRRDRQAETGSALRNELSNIVIAPRLNSHRIGAGTGCFVPVISTSAAWPVLLLIEARWSTFFCSMDLDFETTGRVVLGRWSA